MFLTSGVSDVHSLSPSEQSISMPRSPRGWRLPWQAARSPPVRLKLGVMTQVHRRTMPVQHRKQPPPREGPRPPPRPLPLGFLSLQTGCADSRTTCKWHLKAQTLRLLQSLMLLGMGRPPPALLSRCKSRCPCCHHLLADTQLLPCFGANE